jgi:hypothetical protein
MRTRVVPRQIEFWEGEPCVLVDLVIAADTDLPVTSGQVSSVSLYAYDLSASDRSSPSYSESPIDPTTVYYDTVQIGYAHLMGSSEGYNFKLVIDTSTFAFLGGRTYRIQVYSQIGASSYVAVYHAKVGATL